MESDWCDLLSSVLEAILADEKKGMGDVVQKANPGARRHGIRASVLSKMGTTQKKETVSWV